jgi:hypothetical protein
MPDKLSRSTGLLIIATAGAIAAFFLPVPAIARITTGVGAVAAWRKSEDLLSH